MTISPRGEDEPLFEGQRRVRIGVFTLGILLSIIANGVATYFGAWTWWAPVGYVVILSAGVLLMRSRDRADLGQGVVLGSIMFFALLSM